LNGFVKNDGRGETVALLELRDFFSLPSGQSSSPFIRIEAAELLHRLVKTLQIPGNAP